MSKIKFFCPCDIKLKESPKVLITIQRIKALFPISYFFYLLMKEVLEQFIASFNNFLSVCLCKGILFVFSGECFYWILKLRQAVFNFFLSILYRCYSIIFWLAWFLKRRWSYFKSFSFLILQLLLDVFIFHQVSATLL